MQSIVLLPDCSMRTCRKKLFGFYCWSWGARNLRVWYPIEVLEENGGHGGVGGAGGAGGVIQIL